MPEIFPVHSIGLRLFQAFVRHACEEPSISEGCYPQAIAMPPDLMSDPAQKNKLYYSDNLQVLREYIPSQSVGLIYLDPPFTSRQDYNVLFAEKDGTRSASQITAFKDTWEWHIGPSNEVVSMTE